MTSAWGLGDRSRGLPPKLLSRVSPFAYLTTFNSECSSLALFLSLRRRRLHESEGDHQLNLY
eukprot:scaffold13100_cov108-Skeletonema_marinoi.AAC.6